MPGQVLAAGEAQVAGRIVGAVEALRLLLLGGAGAVSVDALGVGGGAVVDGARLGIGVVHVDVERVALLGRLGRALGGGVMM